MLTHAIADEEINALGHKLSDQAYQSLSTQVGIVSFAIHDEQLLEWLARAAARCADDKDDVAQGKLRSVDALFGRVASFL